MFIAMVVDSLQPSPTLKKLSNVTGSMVDDSYDIHMANSIGNFSFICCNPFSAGSVITDYDATLLWNDDNTTVPVKKVGDSLVVYMHGLWDKLSRRLDSIFSDVLMMKVEEYGLIRLQCEDILAQTIDHICVFRNLWQYVATNGSLILQHTAYVDPIDAAHIGADFLETFQNLAVCHQLHAAYDDPHAKPSEIGCDKFVMTTYYVATKIDVKETGGTELAQGRCNTICVLQKHAIDEKAYIKKIKGSELFYFQPGQWSAFEAMVFISLVVLKFYDREKHGINERIMSLLNQPTHQQHC